jgi:hypothetical protein
VQEWETDNKYKLFEFQVNRWLRMAVAVRILCAYAGYIMGQGVRRHGPFMQEELGGAPISGEIRLSSQNPLSNYTVDIRLDGG